MDNKKVYISGPLTHTKQPTEVRKLYEMLGTLCEEYNLDPYIPHLKTDPLVHKNISDFEVYKTDKDQVLSSSLVVANVGEPSNGVGMEIAYADDAGIPIVIMHERDAVVSRIVKGPPTVIAEIVYSTLSEALHLLSEVFSSLDELKISSKLAEIEPCLPY